MLLLYIDDLNIRAREEASLSVIFSSPPLVRGMFYDANMLAFPEGQITWVLYRGDGSQRAKVTEYKRDSKRLTVLE